MSETEHKSGTLKLITLGMSLEETAKTVLQKEGWKKESYHDTNAEALGDQGYKKYFIYGNFIYKVGNVSDHSDSDIFKAKRIGDGQIEFEIKYYNGGCSFDEALEEALDSLDT